jgi:hypothetical protein
MKIGVNKINSLEWKPKEVQCGLVRKSVEKNLPFKMDLKKLMISVRR